jgi:hypothetical protein
MKRMPRKKILVEVPNTITGNSKLDNDLSKFEELSNVDALNVGLALQQILRGQKSLLDNQDKFSEELNRIKARMDEQDKEAIKFNEDREKWITNVLNKAEKLKATGDKKNKLIAKGVETFENELALARANQSVDKLKFEQELARQPKVKIISPGRLETIMQNGQPIAKLFNEEVRIKHKVYVLPAGREIEVPQAVAEILANRRKMESENSELQLAGSELPEYNKLNEKMAAIKSKYNSSMDTPPGYVK